ncbi:SUMF1/EgtB/PvdO family nonheme iron enzyme, partial [Methylomagnum sp.]
MNEEDQKRIAQLRAALDAGLIDQDTYDTAVSPILARLNGGGAIAQGTDAQAVGAGGVGIGGNNSGLINLGLIIQQGTRPGASGPELRRAYLGRLLQQANQLPLFGGNSARAEVRLSSVYTALLTQGGERLPEPGRMDREPARRSALDALNAETKLVLLGGPGSGKTTFVQFVALCLAGEALGVPSVNLQTLTTPIPPEPGSREQEPQPQRWDHRPLLPVHIVLRDFAAELPAQGTAVNAETLWRHLEGRLRSDALADFAPHLHDELLRRGGLVLLDGLDEVPEPEARREQIIAAVQEFRQTFGQCRVLATSRTYAYTRQDWKLPGFAETALLPFSAGQIQRFVTAWYGHMAELGRLSAPEAQGRAALLAQTVDRNPRLAELARYPLLLTLIAKLHTEKGGALPEKREELYQQAVEWLLTEWESLKVRHLPDGRRSQSPSLTEFLNTGRDEIRRELDKLAFEAHRDQADLAGTADIREERLIRALLDAAPGKADLQPRVLQAYLCDRAGLLATHGVGLYQFPHRTFQEYLAACHLTGDGFPDQLADLLRREPNRWREAVLLAAAKVARGTPESVWSLVDALCPAALPIDGVEPPAADQWAALLAGHALWETGLAEDNPQLAARHRNKWRRVRDWIAAIARRGWLPTVDRAIAGAVLSVMGDGRDFGDLIEIPAGGFWMGSDDGHDDEKPRHRVELPADYQIGKYPVTNGQYRRFVEATQRGWESPERDRLDKRNHPARWVSWHDALAYCGWLTDEWRQAGRISPDESFALPSEAEWERAARGTAGRIYPWGENWQEDCANIGETDIGNTCAVGLFPQGRSEAGCLDMAGNVWEWTRSLWGRDFSKPDFAYPYEPTDIA